MNEMAKTQRMVKLYAINTDRQWINRGRGYVYYSCEDRFTIHMRSKAAETRSYKFKIRPNTAYEMQVDDLILWTEDKVEYFLRFETSEGCEKLWKHICQFQGKDPSLDTGTIQHSVDRSEWSVDTPVDLPPCERTRLGEINKVIGSNMCSESRNDKLVTAIENDDYIRKLTHLFHECEELGDKESLHYLNTIFKKFFLMNHNSLFEIMFREEIIFDVIGCLEYDPSYLTPQYHRQYLKDASRYKEVIPIRNAELLAKIHQTLPVKYIHDVILPTPSCSKTHNRLSNFLHFNKIAIVELIQEDEKFLNDLFLMIRDPYTDNSKRRNLILFVKEFCNFSQNLLHSGKELLFKTLYSLGILPALAIALKVNDSQTKGASIDVLSYLVEFSPSIVRCYTLQQSNNTDADEMLINIIIEQMVCDSNPDIGITLQVMSILKRLLGVEKNAAFGNEYENSEFLNYFYTHSLNILVTPVLVNTVEACPSKEEYQTVELLAHIIELLSFCVECNARHMKKSIICNDLLRRVLVLVNSSHTYLALSAIRFMRKIISLKDECYNSYIINGNLFAPVVNAYLRNGGRYNMMDSAVLEMFEFIRLANIKSLYLYVVRQFGVVLQDIGI